MKSTVKIYIGRPVSGAEAKAVKRLHSHLSQQGVRAVLLINFTARSRQIDCVVITSIQATMLDFKEISGPVRGGLNGPWLICSHGGGETRYPGENPYGEVSTAKYALSDEMAHFQRKTKGVPPARMNHFYSQFEAAVCICPDIVTGSSLSPGNFKCWIWGFPEAIAKICTRKIESSWDIEQWAMFARYLGLEEVSLDSATDARCRSAEQALSEYRTAFVNLVSHNLPPSLLGFPGLPCNEHFLLLGPSGIGKTTRLHHHALESLQRDTFVLFVEAMHYAGEFRALLQKAIAPFFTPGIEVLLSATSTCGHGVLLVIDAFDRCKECLRPGLLRDIIAFHKLHDCQVAITSQFDPDLPAAIKGQVVRMESLSSDQKLAVFRSHADTDDLLDQTLLEPFETAHDLMVLASCRSQVPAEATRCDIYDAYVLQCLPAKHSAVAGALCRDLAAALSRDFAAVMSRQDFERHAEAFVRKQGVSLDVIDEVRRSRLIKISLASFSFSHEQIQEHLYADWICRSAPDSEALCSKLREPGHRALALMAISRQRSVENAQKILRVAGSVPLLDQIFRGTCGTIARQALLHDYRTLVADAVTDVPNVAVTLEADPENGPKAVFARLDFTGCHAWSAYEIILAAFIGKNLSIPEFAEAMADLIAIAGASIYEATASTARGVGISPRTAFDHVLHDCFVWEDQLMKFPALAIFKAWRSYHVFNERDNSQWGSALWSRSNSSSPGTQAFILMALCKLHEWNRPSSTEALEEIFRRAWDSCLYTLRSEALHMLTNAARGDATESLRQSQGIRNLLSKASESTGDENIFFNTLLIDAMNAYGMIDPPIEASHAVVQLRGVVNPESDYARKVVEVYQVAYPGSKPNALAHEAYRLLGFFFEEVFQGVYWEAFEKLSKSEKIAFMNLAAQSKDPHFHIGYILAGLVQTASHSSLPAFQRFASQVNVRSASPQEAVEGYLFATIGCAKLGAPLPPWELEKTVANEAWRIIREIVYEHFKGNTSAHRVHELWLTLRAEAGLGIADVLLAINRAHTFSWGGARLRVDLRTDYPQQVKLAMEHSLSNLTKLVSAWERGIWPDDAQNRSIFVLTTLGDVGDESTLWLLKPFTNDAILGEAAIAASKAINCRQRLKSLSPAPASPT